jgi:hypothetical protein
MKGDFTRSTFDPKKSYSSVRMQQGRLQLDADWNEQVDIQNYFLQTCVKDIIGNLEDHWAGAPKTKGEEKDYKNFLVELITNTQDFKIYPGRIYVDGILCELDTIIQYKTQFNHSNDLQSDFKEGIQDGDYYAYLDVWERHITAIEDPDLREVALNGSDTTTRTKIVWQVKLILQSKWKDLLEQEKKPVTIKATATNLPSENQLYRIEIHEVKQPSTETTTITKQPSTETTTITFKWARDNASTVFAIDEQGTKDNVIAIRSAGRDISQSFAPGQWIEIINETQEKNNQSGTLVQLLDVISITSTGSQLIFDPSTVIGDSINQENLKVQKNPKVRRWDGVYTAKNSQVIEVSDIGIKVQFNSQCLYRAGDYWLLPNRINQTSPEWSDKDLDSQGVRHHYCKLASLTSDKMVFKGGKDLRPSFPSLVQCLNFEGADSSISSLGVGTPNPQAVLDIQSNAKKQPGKGRIHSDSQDTTLIIGEAGSDNDFDQFNSLHIGDTITVYQDTDREETRTITAIHPNGNSWALRVDSAFTISLPEGTLFNYRVNSQAGNGTIHSDKQDKTLIIGEDVSTSGEAGTNSGFDKFASLHVGDTIIANGQSRTIKEIHPNHNPWMIRVDSAFEPDLLEKTQFRYQQPIARFGNYAGDNHVLITQQGKIKANSLELQPTGSFETGIFIGNQLKLQQVQPDQTRVSYGSIQADAKEIKFTANATEAINFKFLDGNVSIEKTGTDQANLIVDGKASVGTLTIDPTATLNVAGLLKASTLSLEQGITVNQFVSTCDLNQGKDTAIPTVQATINYIDPKLDAKADKHGNSEVDFNVKLLTAQNLNVTQNGTIVGKASIGTPALDPAATLHVEGLLKTSTLSLDQGITVNQFSNTCDLNQGKDTAVPTVQATTNYIDPKLDAKADKNGNSGVDFNANLLTAQTLSVAQNGAIAGKASIGTPTLDSAATLHVEGLLKTSTLSLDQGITVNQFVNTCDLSQSQDTAVPTVQATTHYIDSKLGAKADKNGNNGTDFNAKLLTVQTLSVAQNGAIAGKASIGTSTLDSAATLHVEGLLKTSTISLEQGITVNQFANTFNLSQGSYTAVPTIQAVMDYVGTQLNAKADQTGNSEIDFNAKLLTAQNLSVVQDGTIAGRAIVGTSTPISARLQVQGAAKQPGTLTSVTKNQLISNQPLTVGDTVSFENGASRFIVTKIDANDKYIATFSPPINENENITTFGYQAPIACFVDDQAHEQLTVTANGTVLIGAFDVSDESFPISDEVQLYVNGKEFAQEIITNQLTQISSQILKENITKLSSQEVIELLKNLHPVKYSFKADRESKIHVGFISEESPDLVTSSDKSAISPVDIVAILTKVVQDQQQVIKELAASIDSHERVIVALYSQLRELEEKTKPRAWFRSR